MDKKGKNDNNVWVSIVLGILVILIFFAVINTIAYNKARHEACQELGYEEYVYSRSFDFCDDINGDLHYVRYKELSVMSMFCLTKDCFDLSMKEISVGDVRVVRGT